MQMKRSHTSHSLISAETEKAEKASSESVSKSVEFTARLGRLLLGSLAWTEQLVCSSLCVFLLGQLKATQTRGIDAAQK